MIQRDRGRQRRAGTVLVSGLLSVTLASLGLVQACTTDTPREHFGGSNVGPATGGSVPRPGGSGGGSGYTAAEGGSNSDAGMGGEDSGGSSSTGGDAGSGSGGGGGSMVPTYDCGPRPAIVGPFSTEALRGAASDCAIWHYSCFEGSASVLSELVGDYVEEPTSTQRLALARGAWLDAMARWSQVELFQFGPIASKIPAAGRDEYQGLSLREPIYSWPSTARCRVEELIINQAYSNGSASVVMSGRGLFALEYLLFYQGDDTVCAAATATATTWATLSTQQIQQKKQDYALWLGGDIHTRATDIVQRWSPDGANFRQQFIDAVGYPDAQKALTVLAWALLYIEHEAKDWKLGYAAGINPTAPVSGFEAPFARVATQNLRANLRGFRSLFQGCGENGEGIGFDDWLIATGHSDLASRMVVELDEAQVSLDALPRLDAASQLELQAAYDSLRDLTTLLKTEFLVALNLALPDAIGDDTD